MSHRALVPACYFPSTVLFADDSIDFISNLCFNLEKKIVYQLCNSGDNAITVLNRYPQKIQAFAASSQQPTPLPGLSSSQYVHLNLEMIVSEVYNPNRFAEISVLVVDYVMPGIDGISLCEKLRDNPIKKILLTGRADERTALRAFNTGVIDRFIHKDSVDALETIRQTISHLQYQYFLENSDFITRLLAIHSSNCLRDTAFYQYFSTLIRSHQIVEYYLMEASGSFLLLDAEGRTFCLIVKTANNLAAYYAQLAQQGVSAEVIHELKNSKRIPCFWHEDQPLNATWDEWSTCFYPAECVKGQETYYCAFVKKPSTLNVQETRILSYNKYLAQLDLQHPQEGVERIVVSV